MKSHKITRHVPTKPIALILALSLLPSVFTHHLWADKDRTFDDLKKIYESNLHQLKKEFNDNEGKAKQTYLQSLATLQAGYKQKGELEGLIAARDEAERFGRESFIPSPSDKSLPAPIRRAQGTYVGSVEKLLKEQDHKKYALLVKYASYLEDLKKNLVINDQVDEALRTDTEFKQAQTEIRILKEKYSLTRKIKEAVFPPPKQPILVPISQAGLLLYYNFDQQDKDRVHNAAGLKNHATFHGGATYTDGLRGRGALLKGKEDYISCDARDVIQATYKAVTLSIWVRLNQKTTYGRIISVGKLNQGGPFGLSIGSSASPGGLGLNFGKPPAAGARTPLPARVGKWVHLAGVYDGQTSRVYVTGKEYISTNVPQEHHGKALKIDSGMELWIGRSASRRTWTDTHVLGTIDEVMIFKRALSADEMKRLYKFQSSAR